VNALLARRRQLLLTAASKKSKSLKLLKTLKAVHTKKLLFGANATASSKFLSDWREKGSVSFSAFHLSVFLSFSLYLSVSFFLSFSLFSSSSGSK
jgi:hypothetical protein